MKAKAKDVGTLVDLNLRFVVFPEQNSSVEIIEAIDLIKNKMRFDPMPRRVSSLGVSGRATVLTEKTIRKFLPGGKR